MKNGCGGVCIQHIHWERQRLENGNKWTYDGDSSEKIGTGI